MIKHKMKMLKELKISLALFSFLITSISVMIFALLEYWIYTHNSRSESYHPIDALGMVIPMGVVMGIISWIIIKISYASLSHLMLGIYRVAKGDFKTKLEVEKGGLFKEVYRNFNKMVDELRNTETLRDDFINHFSHEFKTPIMSINGFSALLLKQNISKEDEKKYLKIISEESKRLAELSENSLLLSKLDSKEIHSNKTSYSLEEQIRECVILLSPLWTEKDLTISAELSPVTVEADMGLMKHVWINLLSNAIKYTPPNGSITIDLTLKNEECLISIKDTGIGMDKEDLPKVFNKFYKGKRVYMSTGLGLGLSIVKKILDLSEGTIHADSSPGKGSCFSVSLPIKKSKK